MQHLVCGVCVFVQFMYTYVRTWEHLSCFCSFIFAILYVYKWCIFVKEWEWEGWQRGTCPVCVCVRAMFGLQMYICQSRSIIIFFGAQHVYISVTCMLIIEAQGLLWLTVSWCVASTIACLDSTTACLDSTTACPDSTTACLDSTTACLDSTTACLHSTFICQRGNWASAV